MIEKDILHRFRSKGVLTSCIFLLVGAITVPCVEGKKCWPAGLLPVSTLVIVVVRQARQDVLCSATRSAR